jgi:xylulokinase
MDYFIGIDLGTTGLKTTLLDTSGTIVSSEYVEYPILSPQKGYAEQNPENWWTGLVTCCRSLQTNYPRHMSSLLGVGICGQMHTQVYLDGRMKILRPSITWMDQRSSGIVSRIKQDPDVAELVFRETKNFATTTYTALHMKWVQENQPEIWNRLKHVLIAKDFLKYRLTGEMVTDYSDAAGTLLFDVQTCRWSQPMMDFFNFSPSLLPEALPSDKIIGKISRRASAETGIPVHTPVVNGSADHAAASLGAGVVRSGQVTVIIGTAGVISVCSDQPLPDDGDKTLCWNYCLRDKWVILGIMQTAGESLNWFKNAFDPTEASGGTSGDIFEIYNRITAEVPDGSNGLIFLPYLNGERTPYWDPEARGVFFGIDLATEKAHFIKAIMEGVSFALRQNIATVEDLGIGIDEVRFLGGGSKSPVWLNTLAKIIKKPIKTVRVKDAGALGATILCGKALGVFPSVEKAVETMAITDEEIHYEAPQTIYEKQYQLFLELYENLQHSFQKAARRNNN